MMGLISPTSLAVLGGALALAGGFVGSSIGIGIAASAGAAALAEDRGQFRNVVVLASLPMTQTFYGLIVLILIITGVVPKLPETGSAGFAVFAIGLITAAAECFSAWQQGVICASGISLLPKTKGAIFTHSVLLAVLVELLGVLGLVFAIMSLTMLNLM
jgi:V/A-type H+-transporting ATPase subunit K